MVDEEGQTDDGPIKSCCCLGNDNTHFNAKSSGVYTFSNFGGVKCSNTRAQIIYITAINQMIAVTLIIICHGQILPKTLSGISKI